MMKLLQWRKNSDQDDDLVVASPRCRRRHSHAASPQPLATAAVGRRAPPPSPPATENCIQQYVWESSLDRWIDGGHMYAVSSSSRGCFVRRASELYILSTINTEWLLFRTAKKGAGFWRTSFYIKKSSIPKNYNNLDYQSKFLECARTYA